MKEVTFTDNDKELIARIEKYRKEKNLKSFVGAVRQLCTNALTMKETIKKL